MEPTKAEKKFLAAQQSAIKDYIKEEKQSEHAKIKEKVKDLYCMGIKTKLAKGPNPLSMLAPKNERSIAIKKKKNGKRRPRKGKRSRELSQLKKQLRLEQQGIPSGDILP